MSGQPACRLARWLLSAALATLCCRAAAADNYTLSLQPAWGGHIKPGVPSELTVSLLATSGGRARLTVLGSRAEVSGDAVFEAGIPLQTHIPLVHDTVQPVAVVMAIDGQTVRRETQALQVLAAASTVVAVVNPDAASDWPAQAILPEDATVLYAASDELPATGQAYDLLSALFMTESALRTMTGTQRQALEDYAARCGLLYLDRITTSEAQALRAAAGCGGRNLIAPSLERAGAILPEAVIQRTTEATLSQLLTRGHDPVLRSLCVFLPGYVIVLVLGARSARTASALLALPPAATALAIVAWLLASPRVQVASLAEMVSGDPAARFAGLLQVTGTAPREIVLEMPVQLGSPSAQGSGQKTQIEIDLAQQRQALHVDTTLMSRHTFLVAGIAQGSALTLERTATGVNITNRGDFPSASALLAWRGQCYDVPGLAPSEQWSNPLEGRSCGRTPADELLRRKATDGGSWLLLPYDIPDLQLLAGENDGGGWLLIKGAADA
ncbi:MAG: hypothetical protein H6986_13025 [Pseudomonadales bacterium]|nr:hypothetical protein [Pseudomonadales bacterium]